MLAALLFACTALKPPLTAPDYRCGRDSGTGNFNKGVALDRGPGARVSPRRWGFPRARRRDKIAAWRLRFASGAPAAVVMPPKQTLRRRSSSAARPTIAFSDALERLRDNSSATSAGRPSKSGTCEIAETQLGLRDSSQLGHSAGYRPHPDPSQTAFRACKEPMSDIWRWPVLKLKMAIRSRQRTTISTPNIISDRCAPNRHNKRRLTKTRSTKESTMQMPRIYVKLQRQVAATSSPTIIAF